MARDFLYIGVYRASVSVCFFIVSRDVLYMYTSRLPCSLMVPPRVPYAPMSTRSSTLLPVPSRASVISRHLGLHVIVTKKLGFPCVRTIAMASLYFFDM